MKKIIGTVIFLAVSSTMFFSQPTVCAAADNVTILTEAPPPELVQQVMFGLPYYSAMLAVDDKISDQSQTLGQPFPIFNDDLNETTFCFPFYVNKKLVKTVIGYRGHQSWQTNLSGFLVPELKDLFTSKGYSARNIAFIQKNEDIYLFTDAQQLTLFYDSKASKGSLSPEKVNLRNFSEQSLVTTTSNTASFAQKKIVNRDNNFSSLELKNQVLNGYTKQVLPPLTKWVKTTAIE